MLSIGAKPERVSVHYMYGVSKTERYLRMDPSDESFTLPENGEGYLIVRAGWTEGGITFDATYVIKVLGTPELAAIEEARQGKVYIWFDALKDSGWRNVSEDVLKTAEGSRVELPEYPNARFYKEILEPIGKRYITYEMGGTDVVPILITGDPVLNVFFCDLNEDGKPEICATCLSGPDASDRFISIYDIENSRYYELSERGFNYTLAERNGLLIAMKRTHQETSSVGADGVLAIRDGKLGMAPLGAGMSGASEQLTLILPEQENRLTDDSTVIINRKVYYTDHLTHYLPYGYTLAGELSKQQANGTMFAGAKYYMAEGQDDVYVESRGQRNAAADDGQTDVLYGYFHFRQNKSDILGMLLSEVITFSMKKGNIYREEFAQFARLDATPSAGENYTIRIDGVYSMFIRFDANGKADICKLFYKNSEAVDMLKESAKPFIDAHYVVDIIDTAETHAAAREKFWEDDGLEFCFPVVQSGSMYVVMADGNRTPLKEALEKRLILVTDIPRFGFKVYIKGLYEGELKGLIPERARLAQLKKNCPLAFGLNLENGLMICVSSLAPNHYSCRLFPGGAKGVYFLDSPVMNSHDVELVLKYAYGSVPDSAITIRPFYDPASSYFIVDTETYKNDLKALFGGRFEVGDPIAILF